MGLMAMRPALIVSGVTAALMLAGCVDEYHHGVHHPAYYEEHHEEHHDDHHPHYVVAQPPPPAHPPANATGPGHWVWDPQEQQHLWVQP
jgi:hypothetical protein